MTNKHIYLAFILFQKLYMSYFTTMDCLCPPQNSRVQTPTPNLTVFGHEAFGR